MSATSPADLDDGDEFNWSRDEDAVVVRYQDAIAVYPNKYGGVVVRRERAWDEENDVAIVIVRERAIKVAYAILNATGHGDIQFHRASSGFEDAPDSADETAKRPPTERNHEPQGQRYPGQARNGNGADMPTAVADVFPMQEAAE